MMRLKVLIAPDGKKTDLTAEWGCNDAPTPQCTSTSTTTSFRFRALLVESGTQWVVLARD
jgi:hypothetical protein